MTKRDLPVGVYRKSSSSDLLVVKVSEREKGQVYVGCFDNLSKAVQARDSAIDGGTPAERRGVKKKAKGKPERDLPVGVYRHATGKKFRAMVSVKGKPVLVGYFSSVDDAVEARESFIEAMKKKS